MEENNVTYTVKEVVKETGDVFTLKLSNKGKSTEYKAGQFTNIFFPDTGHAEGKSYSISSAPTEDFFSITVKGVGKFSNKLIGMKAGDKVSASSPNGYFYSEEIEKPKVIITGGIGIAPFRSMILESCRNTPNRKIILFYSNKTKEDIIFKKEFDNLAKKSKDSFKVNYYITREDEVSGMKKGRITVADVVKESKKLKDAEFFICGSITLVRDYWRGLKDSGVPEEKIYTEAFF